MRTFFSTAGIGLAVLAAGLLAGCERPPVDSVQHGFRGTGMVQVYNPRTLAEQAPNNVVPPSPPAANAEGPKASQVYQNVKVLGDLSVAQFARHMVSITAWVAPEQGCNYCHNAANFADDSKYTKVVARRMLQMTQHVNQNWKNHVGATGVTCYTCHRGQPVPSQVWFAPLVEREQTKGLIGNDAGQNHPSETVGLASLPFDPFTPYLLNTKGSEPIRVAGTTALPTGNRQSTKQTEFTYSLMVHMSQSLGVNCTYCHNSRSFGTWAESPPQRATAYHGIRMARDINTDYIVPLTDQFPANRLGPTGDVAKVNCATCHQGAYKPLYGVSMIKDHPELATISAAMSAAMPAAMPASGASSPSASAAPSGVLAKLLFEVGQATLTAEGQAAIAAAAKTLADNPALKVDLSGYADSSGSKDKNLELAKQRAFAVRDALKAAGVAEDRITLKKPEFAVGGAEADARRVDIVAAG
jgi:photosynthetic reaction center cytochrome c subunit